MSFRWDKSEVDGLTVDLSKAPARIQRKAPSVFLKGAIETKRRMQKDARGHDYLGDLAGHVGHDRLGFLRHEIGFNKVGQGNLAAILVNGSVNSAPILETPLAHARRETVEIERHLADAGEDAVLGDLRR